MALEDHYRVMLEEELVRDFVPHLPPLLRPMNPAEDAKKNCSRAFAAFVLNRLTTVAPDVAAKSVTDDFGDFGLDAVYYHAPERKLYLVQSKMKAMSPLNHDESLEFCQGVRKLIGYDFTRLNANFQNRRTEIEGALENCRHIQLVIAHIAGILGIAKADMNELFADKTLDEERLCPSYVDYDQACIVRDLQQPFAYESVSPTLHLLNFSKVETPRETYFGLVKLNQLADLHKAKGGALYAKNIRAFLGADSVVNDAIQQTLSKHPEDFLYLNNGVTALCESVELGGNRDGKRTLNLGGFSIINGAQTVASAAQFVAEHPDKEISSALVSLTIIKSTRDDAFGKAITYARNHQNTVQTANFAALDEAQERLRRDLARIGVRYVYQAEATGDKHDRMRIQLEQAALALALLQKDPRYAVWMYRNRSLLTDDSTDQYKALFHKPINPYQLVNATRFYSYIQRRMAEQALATSDPFERLVYSGGVNVLTWILAKRVVNTLAGANLIDDAMLDDCLSRPFDIARQTMLEETWKFRDTLRDIGVVHGPTTLFRNQTYTLSIIESIMIKDYKLTNDDKVQQKQRFHKKPETREELRRSEYYPVDLFNYLVEKAPAISIVAVQPASEP